MAGRIRGLAGVVGCNNARVTHDAGIMRIVRELIENDVLVVVTGCAATGAAKDGYLRPELMAKAGPGLREVCEAIGIPPVLHVGSCVDNSRILTILTQCATEGGLGEDIADLPAVGICPEFMSEKAISIGTYAAASGITVFFGVHNPVAGSEIVTELMAGGWKKAVGGQIIWEPDVEKLLAGAFGHIDAKRAELGLPAYDPTRFGESGDRQLQRALEQLGYEAAMGLYSAPDRHAAAGGE